MLWVGKSNKNCGSAKAQVVQLKKGVTRFLTLVFCPQPQPAWPLPSRLKFLDAQCTYSMPNMLTMGKKKKKLKLQ